MGNIILIFLKDLLDQCGDFIDSTLDVAFETLAHNTFFIEDSLGFSTGINFDFDFTMAYVMKFAVTLIILKFIYKGVMTYLAWTDDPNTDPIVMATNFVKALVVALSFPLLYSWLCQIVEDFTNGLLKVLSIDGTGIEMGKSLIQGLMNGMTTMGMVQVIFLLIFVVTFVILYIKFLMRAAELLIIRVGLPLACVGMIDANGGIFTSYQNKMFQTVLSVVVQIALAKLGILLAISNHLIWAIVFILLAIKSPQILRDLIYTPSGGGGLSTAYYGTMMARMIMRR